MLFLVGMAVAAPVPLGLLYVIYKRTRRPWLRKTALFLGLCYGWLTLTVAVSVWAGDLTAMRSPKVFSAVFLSVGLLFLTVAVFSGVPRRAKRITAAVLAAALAGSGVGMQLYQSHYDAVPKVETADVLYWYDPYLPDTRTVSLPEESTLRLTENLPVLDGATALFPVYAAFAKAVYPREALETEDPLSYTVDDYDLPGVLKCTTTSGAYKRIVTGEADIIFVAAPSEQQKQFAEKNGVELVYTPIGREAFVFFVNTKNPLQGLTVEQVKQIYSGKITRWEELGVKGLGPIEAFQREEGSGSQSALLRLMGDTPLAPAPTERVIAGMGGIIEQTADYKNFKNALGYSFRFYCNEMVGNGGVRLLPLDGVEPTAEHIADGTYPQASSFFAVTRADADETVRAFVDWMTGPQGQELVERTGYVRQMAQP